MTRAQANAGGRGQSGLRTRYVPRARIGRGLLSLAPWLDVVLLALFFALTGQTIRLQPGVVVQLPRGAFREGTIDELVVVVLSIRDPATRRTEDIVFFDDVRYRLRSADQAERLQQALRARARKEGGVALVVQADRDVRHGAVTDLMEMALDAGIERVNIGTRTP